jgi:hypothetical protein
VRQRSPRPAGSGWQLRVTLNGDPRRLTGLLERLEELGCSARVTTIAGSWEVDLRSTPEPAPDLLRQAVVLIRREFPDAFPAPPRPAKGRRHHLQPRLGTEQRAPLDG